MRTNNQARHGGFWNIEHGGRSHACKRERHAVQ